MPARILREFASPILRPNNSNNKKDKSPSSGPPVLEIDGMDHIKKPSLAAFGRHSSDGKKERERREASAKHVKLEIVAESPPALFIGDPQHSSGALYSCKIKMVVRNQPVTLTTFNLQLNAVSSTKRPVSDRCADCTTQTSTLKEWTFLTEPTSFPVGEHEFPASYLIPGHLPVTTHGHIGNVDYQFVAKAMSTKSETFDVTKPLVINRALAPGGEKNSVRIFPPTNLTPVSYTHLTLPTKRIV